MSTETKTPAQAGNHEGARQRRPSAAGPWKEGRARITRERLASEPARGALQFTPTHANEARAWCLWARGQEETAADWCAAWMENRLEERGWRQNIPGTAAWMWDNLVERDDPDACTVFAEALLRASWTGATHTNAGQALQRLALTVAGHAGDAWRVRGDAWMSLAWDEDMQGFLAGQGVAADALGDDGRGLGHRLAHAWRLAVPGSPFGEGGWGEQLVAWGARGGNWEQPDAGGWQVAQLVRCWCPEKGSHFATIPGTSLSPDAQAWAVDGMDPDGDWPGHRWADAIIHSLRNGRPNTPESMDALCRVLDLPGAMARRDRQGRCPLERLTTLAGEVAGEDAGSRRTSVPAAIMLGYLTIILGTPGTGLEDWQRAGARTRSLPPGNQLFLENLIGVARMEQARAREDSDELGKRLPAGVAHTRARL